MDQVANAIHSQIAMNKEQVYQVTVIKSEYEAMPITPEMEARVRDMMKGSSISPDSAEYPKLYQKQMDDFQRAKSLRVKRLLIYKNPNFYICAYSPVHENEDPSGSALGFDKYLNINIFDYQQNRYYEVDNWAKRIVEYEKFIFIEDRTVELTIYPENMFNNYFLEEGQSVLRDLLKRRNLDIINGLNPNIKYFEYNSLSPFSKELVGLQDEFSQTRIKEIINIINDKTILSSFVWSDYQSIGDSRIVPFLMENKIFNDQGELTKYTSCRILSCMFDEKSNQPESVKQLLLDSMKDGYSYVFSSRNGKEIIKPMEELKKRLESE